MPFKTKKAPPGKTYTNEMTLETAASFTYNSQGSFLFNFSI